MAEVTIREIIDRFTELADEFGDDVVVRLAHQPRYPLEYSIGRDVDRSIVGVGTGKDQDTAVVYIGEGAQLGYLSGRAAARLGWSDEDRDEDVDDSEFHTGGSPAAPRK